MACVNLKNIAGEKIAKKIQRYSMAYYAIDETPPSFRITEVEHYDLACYVTNKLYIDTKQHKISEFLGIKLEFVEKL